MLQCFLCHLLCMAWINTGLLVTWDHSGLCLKGKRHAENIGSQSIMASVPSLATQTCPHTCSKFKWNRGKKCFAGRRRYRSQGRKSTAGVTPRRRSPASVSRRGSSQPETIPPVASRLSFLLLSTLCVRFRRPYSQTTGKYISRACRHLYTSARFTSANYLQYQYKLRMWSYK